MPDENTQTGRNTGGPGTHPTSGYVPQTRRPPNVPRPDENEFKG